ncbi:MAG: MoaD/ThiS family protein [Bacteroidota bacterium]|nr:MoaD/ThiS family protein [Bacteroidota bacterium]MDQ6904776.1 MoaD/ThiS family protein [Bacteroidota bacterium]
MIINVIMFGIAQEIFGETLVEVESSDAKKLTVANLKSLMEADKPALKELGSYMIAVNNEYAADDFLIKEKDEVAVIPPVSGG